MRTIFKQISGDQETAIVLFLRVTKYSIWIHRNSVMNDNAVLNIGSIIRTRYKNKIRTKYSAEKTRSNETYECAIKTFFTGYLHNYKRNF